MKQSNGIGVCIKDITGLVTEQNDACRKICGNQVGQVCEKGCMARYKISVVSPAFDVGIHPLSQVETDNVRVEAVIINDGTHLTTLLLDAAVSLRPKLEHLQRFGLTATESVVLEHYLFGLTRTQIATKMCISIKTIKTHLNNIYKKIPTSVKLQIQTTHKEMLHSSPCAAFTSSCTL